MFQKFDSALSLDARQLGLEVLVKHTGTGNSAKKPQANLANTAQNGVNGKTHSKNLNIEESLLQEIVSGKWAKVFDANPAESRKFAATNAQLVEIAKQFLRSELVDKSSQFAFAFISWNKTLDQPKFTASKFCGEFVGSQSNANKVKIIEFLISLLTVFKGHFAQTSQHNTLALVGFIADQTSLVNSDESERNLFESCIQTVSEHLTESHLRTSIRSSLEMLQKSSFSTRKTLRYEPIEF